MRVAFTGHRPEQLHIGHNELSEEGQALRDFIRNEIRVLEQWTAYRKIDSEIKHPPVVELRKSKLR